MAQDFLQEGMDLFASGDLAGATRLWLKLVQQDPGNEHARSYLARIREVDPELLEDIASQVGMENPVHVISDVGTSRLDSSLHHYAKDLLYCTGNLFKKKRTFT